MDSGVRHPTKITGIETNPSLLALGMLIAAADDGLFLLSVTDGTTCSVFDGSTADDRAANRFRTLRCSGRSICSHR